MRRSKKDNNDRWIIAIAIASILAIWYFSKISKRNRAVNSQIPGEGIKPPAVLPGKVDTTGNTGNNPYSVNTLAELYFDAFLDKESGDNTWYVKVLDLAPKTFNYPAVQAAFASKYANRNLTFDLIDAFEPEILSAYVSLLWSSKGQVMTP